MKVFRVIALFALLASFGLSTSAGVRNITPVEDPFGCNHPNITCSPGSSEGCPSVIFIVGTDPNGACVVTTCTWTSTTYNPDGTVNCSYHCSTDYCQRI